MLAAPLPPSCLKHSMSHLLAGAAAIVMLAGTVRAAEFSADVLLGNLNGSGGFKILGGADNDRTGRAVSGAGDVNGDGFDDVIVGTDYADPNGDFSGASYVVFGKANRTNSIVQLSALNGKNGFKISGETTQDASGYSVSAAGDVNGDGYGDLIVGAWQHDADGIDKAGASYVVFGRRSAFPANLQLSKLNGDNGFQISGENASDFVGVSVAAAGDVNGDGYDDVIVGAFGHESGGFNDNGAAYVVFGKKAKFSTNVRLSTLDGTNGFRMEGEGEINIAGAAVAGAGDVNGDGVDDMLVGAPKANAGGVLDSGASYVVFGRKQSAGGFPAVMGLSSLTGANGFQMNGEDVDDQSGFVLSAAGDVDGDGFDDVIVGSVKADAEAGKSYVVFGKGTVFSSVISLADLIGFNGFRITGAAAGNESASSVSGNSDVNGDGYDDLIIGAGAIDSNGLQDNGGSYVLFGKATPFVASIGLGALDGSNGFRMSGEAFSISGEAVAAAGDVNGDGFGDVIVGAIGFDAVPNGGLGGGAYVLYGRAPDAVATRDGSDANQTINGGAFADTLSGEGGDDTLEGRGGGDDLDGGTGVNIASYAHAAAAVKASLANPGSNTGHAAGDSYALISGLEGSRFADALSGNAAANRLTGGKGKDKLKGGKGKDIFSYRYINESPKGSTKRDVIADFKPGTASSSVDKIDVSAIDANASKNGNQAFTFIGTTAFSKRGQLRFTSTGSGILVQGNTTGSKAADFEILLKGLSNTSAFTAKDFKL